MAVTIDATAGGADANSYITLAEADTFVEAMIESTDVVVVNHSSAGTAGSYLVQANSIAAGSFKITVANVGSTASEAIVLSFVLLKGASS